MSGAAVMQVAATVLIMSNEAGAISVLRPGRGSGLAKSPAGVTAT